jgi:hypothetical protein
LVSIKDEAEMQAIKQRATRESDESQKGEFKIGRTHTRRSSSNQEKNDAASDPSGITRGYKRRRLSPSSSFSQDPGDINLDQDSVIKAMKTTLKEQALALADLEKENDEASGTKMSTECWELTRELNCSCEQL